MYRRPKIALNSNSISSDVTNLNVNQLANNANLILCMQINGNLRQECLPLYESSSY